tara:strand:- start:455 stop:823 length:369 start_codon:yes stop_codon:yes gene_type:complete
MHSKVIAFDLDDVICTRTSNEGAVEKYRSCQPVPEMIKIINECYDLGAEVVIYTARGMTSHGGNIANIYHGLYELTKQQLDEWGVKHHKLVMGKAHYDLLIDDKVVNSDQIRSVSDIKKRMQ